MSNDQAQPELEIAVPTIELITLNQINAANIDIFSVPVWLITVLEELGKGALAYIGGEIASNIGIFGDGTVSKSMRSLFAELTQFIREEMRRAIQEDSIRELEGLSAACLRMVVDADVNYDKYSYLIKEADICSYKIQDIAKKYDENGIAVFMAGIGVHLSVMASMHKHATSETDREDVKGRTTSILDYAIQYVEVVIRNNRNWYQSRLDGVTQVEFMFCTGNIPFTCFARFFNGPHQEVRAGVGRELAIRNAEARREEILSILRSEWNNAEVNVFAHLERTISTWKDFARAIGITKY